jgi:putative DNA primase/helicase
MGEVIASPFGDRARPGSGGPSLERLASFATNDLGNAYRLILMAGGAVEDDDSGPVVDSTNSRLLFVLGLGWFGFNGRFWDRDCGEDLARKLAHRVALLIPSLYPIFKEKGTPDKDFWKFANETGSAGKTSAMLIQAKSYLGASLSDFDQDLYAINCLNGTLKMRYCDGKFRKSLAPHNPADRITRCTATNYNPDAKAPEFLGVLEKALAKKDERAAFHRMCGYASTGNTQDQAFFFVQGPGQDSKSTLLDACREALGTYGVASKPDTFLESNNPVNRGPEPDIIALAGDSRFVILSEPPRGAKLAEGKLKGWTGGEPLAARDLHSQQINFRPVPKLIFECNSFPVIKGDDDGIYRRIHVVLFRRKVPDSEVDRTLPCRLRENELSGILNWLVDGVGDWMAQGLNWPDSLKIVVRDWRQQASPFGDWLSEYCLIREEARM